jgi:hypothetical protein
MIFIVFSDDQMMRAGLKRKSELTFNEDINMGKAPTLFIIYFRLK